MKTKITNLLQTLCLLIIGLSMSLSLTSCGDDVPDDITDKLVGTWVLHNNPEISGSYVFNKDGSGYFKAYQSYMDYNWNYNSKTIVHDIFC